MSMARRNNNMSMKKLEPAVMVMEFGVSGDQSGIGVPKYIDLSQCASLVNRRFYRQGLNWAVAGFRVTGGIAGSFTVGKLQNTWVTSGAWEKSMNVWLKQQNDALEASSSEETAARFRDFKIHADYQHAVNTFANNLTPAQTLLPGGTFALGEWQHSQIVVPNDGAPGVTSEYNLMMHGPDAGSAKGMIQGYADSRNRPFSPDPDAPVISASWMQEMFDVGDDSQQTTDNAQFRNNELPYDQDNYPGGATNAPSLEFHRRITFTSTNTTGTTILNMAGTNFPCGLIQVTNNSIASVLFEVLLVPGPHRGYLAEPMQDM